jgi:hypothetical protein
MARDEGLHPPLTGLLLITPCLLSERAVPEKYREWYQSYAQNSNAPILSTSAFEYFVRKSTSLRKIQTGSVSTALRRRFQKADSRSNQNNIDQSRSLGVSTQSTIQKAIPIFLHFSFKYVVETLFVMKVSFMRKFYEKTSVALQDWRSIRDCRTDFTHFFPT